MCVCGGEILNTLMLLCLVVNVHVIQHILCGAVPAGRLVPDSPAEKSGALYIYDELLAVNNQDVSRMDHGDIVGLIKSSGTSISLTIQQPEDIDAVVRQQVVRFITVM